MESRSFLMGTQWNIVYYPEKPTGFGVLVIGDERHFVEENKCFWAQNEGKLAIINELKEKGYTIFSSNLYGRNWGSDAAVELAEQLYHHVIRSEILNNKIHILAEGMGALTAVKLMQRIYSNIRSVLLINPILSLKYHLEQEKEHKFFYKRLIRELEDAFQMDWTAIEKIVFNTEETVYLNEVPIEIIHVLSGGRMYKQSKQYQQILGNKNISPYFILPEKKLQLGKICSKFFSNHEAIL
ncbi:hydrolase [Neobacillus sp. Marseille-QA0830]